MTKNNIKIYSGTLLVIGLFISLKASSQDWSFSLANGLAQHKEELLQPIVYKGYNLGIGADYSCSLQNKAVLFADFMASGVYTAKTKLENDMSQLNINLELGYLFKTKKEQWKTGAAIQSQYNYTLYSLNYEYPFWVTQYSLNWHNRLDFLLEAKYKVEVSTSIPLFGFLSRTPKEVLREYKQDYTKAYFHSNMKLASINTFRSLTTSLLFSLNQEKKVKFKIGYRGDFFYYQEPKPVSRIYHSLVLSFKLNK